MPLSKIPSIGVEATGTPDNTTFLRGDGVWATPSTGGGGSAFPTGTVMLFVQTAAPTGWTKSTTHDNKALRVVSGSASSGGSVAFTTAFASGLSSGNTTLSSAQIASHTHFSGVYVYTSTCTGGYPGAIPMDSDGSPITTGGSSGGGGGSHNHTIPSFAVSYVDVIIATAD